MLAVPEGVKPPPGARHVLSPVSVGMRVKGGGERERGRERERERQEAHAMLLIPLPGGEAENLTS